MVSISVLVIVPCGKRKIWDKNPETGPCEARDVYRIFELQIRLLLVL